MGDTGCDFYQNITLLSFIISVEMNLHSLSRAINVMGKVTLDFSQIHVIYIQSNQSLQT